MATLAHGGRIGVDEVAEEIARLRCSWRRQQDDGAGVQGEQLLQDLLGEERYQALDRFDRVQLADVVLVCRRSANLSEAGRRLFAASRARKKSANDADRLRKYLARHQLRFVDVRSENE